jgi:hypothetical protein
MGRVRKSLSVSVNELKRRALLKHLGIEGLKLTLHGQDVGLWYEYGPAGSDESNNKSSSSIKDGGTTCVPGILKDSAPRD